MRRKKIIRLFVAVFLMAGFSRSFALELTADRGPSNEKRMERIADNLGLTQEQKDRYGSAAKRIDDDTKAIRSKNKELVDKVSTDLFSSSPSRETINVYLQQVAQNNIQLQFERVDLLLQLQQEISADQKAKLQKTIMAEADSDNGEQPTMSNRRNGSGRMGGFGGMRGFRMGF